MPEKKQEVPSQPVPQAQVPVNKDVQLIQLINRFTVKAQAVNVMLSETLESAQQMLNMLMPLMNEKNTKILELEKQIKELKKAE